MDFSLKRINGEKIKYFSSERDSSIQLLFIPGLFNSELWRQQFRYFSKKYSTVAFDVWRNERTLERQHIILEQLLENEEFKNVVLVSSGPGNAIAQAAEHREKVVATVLTGATEDYRRLPRTVFNSAWKAVEEPKLMKKIFFSDSTDYRIVRRFVEDVEIPDYKEYLSFTDNYSLRKPVKNSLLVHAENDRFSSKEYIERMKSNSSVAYIRSAGSFPFYEKPQEYNKALLDFFRKIEPFIRERETSRARDRNRSLQEFAQVVE